MIEEWKELKYTITEMRANDGMGTQQDVCKFLVQYMTVLEKKAESRQRDERNKRAGEFTTGKVIDADELKTAFPPGEEVRTECVRATIDHMPPANPKKKIGYWIDTGSGQECSECGEFQPGYDNFRFYCACCGADMRRGKEDEDA